MPRGVTLLCADSLPGMPERRLHCSAQTACPACPRRDNTALRRQPARHAGEGRELLCADSLPDMREGENCSAQTACPACRSWQPSAQTACPACYRGVSRPAHLACRPGMFVGAPSAVLSVLSVGVCSVPCMCTPSRVCEMTVLRLVRRAGGSLNILSLSCPKVSFRVPTTVPGPYFPPSLKRRKYTAVLC